jgi:PPM family protein phosphatase
MLPTTSPETYPYPIPLGPSGRSGAAERAVVGPHVDVYGMSDRGRVRERNEDQFLIADLNRTMLVRDTTLSVPARRRAMAGGQAKLLVVADGVGEHQGGDMASALAVATLAGYVLEGIPWVPIPPCPDTLSGEVLDPFRRALACCEERVRAAGSGRHPAPATTLTVALLTGDVLEVAHAGDSRCYLYRRGVLTSITHDHTVFAMLRDLGAEPVGYRHALYNAIGADDRNVVTELHRVPLEAGDAVLLCSDGLTRHLGDDEIAARLQLGASAQACCEALVVAANDAGGEDNITVLLARL